MKIDNNVDVAMGKLHIKEIKVFTVLVTVIAMWTSISAVSIILIILHGFDVIVLITIIVMVIAAVICHLIVVCSMNGVL